MKRIVNIGTIPTGGTRSNVFCKIETRYNDDKTLTLSISGVIGPLPSGNARGGCGQIDMEFAHRNEADNDKRYSTPIPASDIKFAKGWNASLWYDFLDAWKRYHMNDMHAECEHQRVLGWTYDTHAGQKCPTCGYEIGTQWKSETVPSEVLSFLFALPETTITPAWV